MTRILVIEDDHDLRQMIAEILYHEQYEVIQAPNAAQGIQLGVLHQPDAVLCDWTLPDGDALHVLQALRNQPVIILSGNSTASAIDSAFHNGASDYLTKPFKVKEVVGAVRQVLRTA